MKMPSATLVHTLIGKSIAETLLIGGLAVYAFMSFVPPYFHGWSEVSDSAISGWAVNRNEPGERVEVQLYIDGEFVARQVANKSRRDVQQAGWARDEWHGYEFRLTSMAPGPHVGRIYAMHSSYNDTKKSLQLLGNPIEFISDEHGTLTKIK